MFQDFFKMTQDSLKPALKLAENNTALAVQLLQTQSAAAAELMQSNLAHVQALATTNDMNVAVEMQQKHVETVGQKLAEIASTNVSAIEAAAMEAGKIFEGSFAEVQAQTRKSVAKLEKEFSKVKAA